MTPAKFFEDVQQGYVGGFISGCCSGFGRFGSGLIGGATKGKFIAQVQIDQMSLGPLIKLR